MNRGTPTAPSAPAVPTAPAVPIAPAVPESHADWIMRRSPAAPAALTACVREVLGEHPEWNALPCAEALVSAGEALLARALSGDASLRVNALSLLAADACVTYAFEAAADEPETIAARANAAALRIAHLARSTNAG